jgi:plastocyanin
MNFGPSRVFFLALIFAAGCAAPPAPPPATTGTKRVDPATSGAFAGRIVFAGTPPQAQVLRMGTDAACIQGAAPNPVSDAVLINSTGGLANVFVHVKDGIDPDLGFDVPTTAVILDQKGCVYSPRVVGVRVGQTLDIVNSDPTMHNVHALPTKNQEFNRGQPMQGVRNKEVFTVPEVMVRFMCNVHNWMAAYVGVLPHPFFAVTDADGRFEIKGLPPGTYTIEAWHEKFGTREGQVTIKTGETAALDLTFQPAAGG